MTISDRIFELLDERKMTQRAFSEATNIPQSTISDWKKKSTNPSSDKIMIICDVLEVSPYYLLSGIETAGTREDKIDYMMISKDSEDAVLLETYHDLDSKSQQRIVGYMKALSEEFVGNDRNRSKD